MERKILCAVWSSGFLSIFGNIWKFGLSYSWYRCLSTAGLAHLSTQGSKRAKARASVTPGPQLLPVAPFTYSFMGSTYLLLSCR